MKANGSLSLILAFSRALSHKIRTPLSVISNDLAYFQSLIDSGECDRGIARCRQISDFFKPIESLQSTGTKFEEFSLSELLSEIFPATISAVDFEIKLKGIRNNLLQAFNWIAELFAIETVSLRKVNVVEEFSVNFTLQKPPGFSSEVKGDCATESAVSLTEIYSKEGSDDSILPMLIDAVLLSFAAECRLSAEREISIVFNIK